MAAMSAARGGEPAAIRKTEDRSIPGPAGDIPVRIYWPNEEGVRGGMLYLHGGGHVIGSLDTHDKICRNLCAGGGVVVVSADYRMGPEHKFPAAVDDSWAALEWMAANGGELGVDPAKLVVAGDSAGGNLAGVVALMARDAGAPKLALQVLIYPVGDYTLSAESYKTFGTGYGILTDKAMGWFQEHYLNGPADGEDWRASPLKVASFAGVAPALVIVAECDVLSDDGRAYADALKAAGVETEFAFYKGMIHGFFGMTPDVDDAAAAQAKASAAIRKAVG
jgi:acetyl esterase